ncbi:MAG: hypothetical protein WC076_13715 [Terrimicrobiaceae bacterium]
MKISRSSRIVLFLSGLACWVPLHRAAAETQIATPVAMIMRALKRQPIEALRRGAPKGRKGLYVYDRAGIDFKAWEKWKQTGGIYFLSREKENTALGVMKNLDWDRLDERNAGVQSDDLCESSSGVRVRSVTFNTVGSDGWGNTLSKRLPEGTQSRKLPPATGNFRFVLCEMRSLAEEARHERSRCQAGPCRME